jgi:uncharacterized phage protein (TIGR01671 family)
MTANRFKFRFWDVHTKRMIRYDKTAWHIDDAIRAYYDNPEHFIAMQSTGLVDKSRKEIFEGDIVEFGCDSWTHSEIGIIIWDDYETKFKIDSDPEFPLPWGKLGDIEIIGNIYENPELLKQ